MYKKKVYLMDERNNIKTDIKDLNLIQTNINTYMQRDKKNIKQGIEI